MKYIAGIQYFLYRFAQGTVVTGNSARPSLMDALVNINDSIYKLISIKHWE
jgi:hypothetical protein